MHETTTISFHGSDVDAVVAENQSMANAIQKHYAELSHATVKIFVSPRIEDTEPLEWGIVITSPTGRRSVTAVQRVPCGSILFANN